MNKKKYVTVVVSAVLLFAFVFGAVLLYNLLSERTPADSPMAPPAGQGSGQGASPPPEQGSTSETPPPGQGSEPETPPGQQEDERIPAPDFTVEDIGGNIVKLSDMLGKPVVMSFWASWCTACSHQMPGMNNVFDDFGDDVHFMMINIVDNIRETRESGEAYINNHGYTFPIYFDIGQAVIMDYGVRGIPATFFIDAEGYFVTWVQGAAPEETLRLGISYILN
jgi:peroxiredoxin